MNYSYAILNLHPLHPSYATAAPPISSSSNVLGLAAHKMQKLSMLMGMMCCGEWLVRMYLCITITSGQMTPRVLLCARHTLPLPLVG